MSVSHAALPRARPRRDVRIAALRTAFRTVGTVAPGVAARWAEQLFCRPPRQERRAQEEAFLATGRHFSVRHDGVELRAWEWGSGPAVVLAHGWGSRAGRWSSLASVLLERGFRVVTYDAPAHGTSPGRIASLPEFARALAAVADAAGPVQAIVGHSLGGTAVALALHGGLQARRAVLIASPANPETFADRFAEVLAIPAPVRATMQRNLESRLRFQWSDLHIPTLAAGLRAPALIIHDEGDEDVTSADAAAIAAAWPGARLMLTAGHGHRAIIRAPEVMAAAAEFIGEGHSAAP
jgi:pimeloyl-ACP methyl ester carboxylesterase